MSVPLPTMQLAHRLKRGQAHMASLFQAELSRVTDFCLALPVTWEFVRAYERQGRAREG